MKKIISLSLILIATISFSNAQDKNFQLGFELSPNISWIKPDAQNLESDGSKFGFSYGLIADFRLADNYSFSTGISLLNSGGIIDYPDIQEVSTTAGGVQTNVATSGRTRADIRLQYVQIPLTIKLKTNEIGYMKYYGQFGIGTAINIDATAETEFSYPGGGSKLTNEDVDFADEINLFRASLMVGLGAEYNLSGNTSLMIGLMFDNGFINILSEDNYDADDNGNATGTRDKSFKAINNSMVLNVGVLF